MQSEIVLRPDTVGEDGKPVAGAHGPRKHHNHIFTWEAGDKEPTEEVISNAAVVAEEFMYYHRTHPCPLETCGCVASMDKVNGKLPLGGTFQAPIYRNRQACEVDRRQDGQSDDHRLCA